jgi:transcriptional regulator with XRE-family HTH domain
VDGLYKEFGLVLRAARKKAKLTQSDVADRVGLTRTSITNIERGTQHIALHQLFLLASAVGVQPEDLLPDQEAALEDLVSAKALRAVQAEDEEGQAFVARVLGKSVPRRLERKEAKG